MRIENEFLNKQVAFDKKFGISSEENAQENGVKFGTVLKECVDNVNNKAIQSNEATNSFVKGGTENIDEVMMKATEASLSLQFLTTTRDKLVEGYKELIKMSV